MRKQSTILNILYFIFFMNILYSTEMHSKAIRLGMVYTSSTQTNKLIVLGLQYYITF